MDRFSERVFLLTQQGRLAKAPLPYWPRGLGNIRNSCDFTLKSYRAKDRENVVESVIGLKLRLNYTSLTNALDAPKSPQPRHLLKDQPPLRQYRHSQSSSHDGYQQTLARRTHYRPTRSRRLPRLPAQHNRTHSRILLRAKRSNRRLGSLPSDPSFADGSRRWCGVSNRWRSHSNHGQPDCGRRIVRHPDRGQILGRRLTRQNRSIDSLLVFLLCGSGESWKEEESHNEQR
jgi:hypothetical protein